MMSACRRLTSEDVKLIFDCIQQNQQVPNPQLQFRIVVVPSNGMKLSPPSYEFEDGLYILLKPLPKDRNGQVTKWNPEQDNRIPSNLKRYVMKEKNTESCPWSLSGPQFPVPTLIQQRYCYPKGRPEYSVMKGGALWTMYNENGKENLEYRLLHVYYSAKRAGNTSSMVGINSSIHRVTPSSKRGKTSRTTTDLFSSNSTKNSERISASSSYDSISMDSPLLPFNAPFHVDQLLDTCPSFDIFGSDTEDIMTPTRESFQNVFELNDSHTCEHSAARRPPIHQTNRINITTKNPDHLRMHRILNGTLSSDMQKSKPIPGSYDHLKDLCDRKNPSLAHFQFEQTQTYPLQEHTKPLSPLQDVDVTSFTEQLESFHNDIKKKISKQNISEQRHLLNMYSKWAKQIYEDPLGQKNGLPKQGQLSNQFVSDKRSKGSVQRFAQI